MGGQAETRKQGKHVCIGLLAHVDAGKTTLSEGILYLTGAIRRLGRVDNRDAFLDNFALERARGITIFSKQAEFKLGETSVTLLDTPGHVDFSAEAERTLQVLDYAILVINRADGVQGHTETLWRLLLRYRIPTFLFVNKMDLAGTDRDGILSELKRRLDGAVTDFGGLTAAAGRVSGDDALMEELATCDEPLLEEYLDQGTLALNGVRRAIRERKLFPCYFGSALKLTGVEEFLSGIEAYAECPAYPEMFGARAFKITHDGQGNRLTHLKITGGTLRVREPLGGAEGEKVNQIRIYSGAKFDTVPEAGAGMICAVTGLTGTAPGQGFGREAGITVPLLEPVLTYRVSTADGTDAHTLLKALREIEEEDPQLHIVWSEELGEIQAKVMGDVQMEVLQDQMNERFGIDINFGDGNIVYKETILKAVEGVGHYEPLRHYAEVHLLMEPGEPGSGLQFAADCSEDVLDRNWQRLVLTHLEEKPHRGVLTGSEITDMRITLVGGRSHLKHTEGGDFRQATYRAVRQGLKEAGCRLLEPYYAFRLEIPSETLGRAMNDIERMQGKFDAPEQTGDTAVLSGSAPVSGMRGYQREVTAYTRGRGRLSCSLLGYGPCHNEAEVVEASGYDFDLDLQDPAGSVFCSHGAGFVVPWDEVKRYMHVETAAGKALNGQARSPVSGQLSDTVSGQPSGMALGQPTGGPASERPTGPVLGQPTGAPVSGQPTGVLVSGRPTGAPVSERPTGMVSGRTPDGRRRPETASGTLSSSYFEDKELEQIFIRTYGEPKRRYQPGEENRRIIRAASERENKTESEPEEEYLLVDGYNIIFAWDELHELADVNVDAARYRLMDILCNYQGFVKCTLIVVFDAYKVAGNTGEAIKYHNINVVYTKEAETADQYIEKLAHKIGRKYRVTVATSDGLEQLIIHGQGCALLSAQELKEEIFRVGRLIAEEKGKHVGSGKNYLLSHADGKTKERLEKIRLGEEEPEAGKGGAAERKKGR